MVANPGGFSTGRADITQLHLGAEGACREVQVQWNGIHGLVSTPGHEQGYRGTSLIRNRTPLGPYSRPMVVLGGGGLFLMSEVPL
jgi:hypothetical protein